jgi:hypothetical protein
MFETRHSCAGCVCEKLSLLSLHKHNAVLGEFSHFGRCTAAAMCYNPPSTAGVAGASGRCEMRRQSRRLALELVNAQNRARYHPGCRVFDSALDLEASEVRKLTALMSHVHDISDAPELSVSGELYQGHCLLRGH